MSSIEKLEQYWHNLVLTILGARDLEGAVVACYPEVPMYPINHAADIIVSESKAEDLVKTITEYFSSRGSPYTCFRTSPITRPRGFTSLLENYGFESVLALRKRLDHASSQSHRSP